MEIPKKADERQYRAPGSDLSAASSAIQSEVRLYEQATNVFVGFTDAMMGRYAVQLEKDGKKQALIDAYEGTKKGEKQPVGGTEFTKYGQGYEEMSQKIYLNQLKIEADAVTHKYAMEFKEDPAGFSAQMAAYVQSTEIKIPEEYREGWYQELMGLAATQTKKIEAAHLKMVTENYAASFVNSTRVTQKQALEAAEAKNEGLMDSHLRNFYTNVDEMVLNDVMTPAQGEKMKYAMRAGVGEEYIMSHFTDTLEADLPAAMEFQRSFAESKPEQRMGGSLSWRNKNPGNIEASSWAKKQPGYIGTDGRFAIFETEQDGRDAQIKLLTGTSYNRLNMEQMINRYAPASDNNNTAAYVKSLLRKTKMDPAKKMGDYTRAEMENLVMAMQVHEGWKEGTTDSPWEYNTEERDTVAAKMERMINAKLKDIKAAKTASKAKNLYDIGEGTKTYKDGGVPPNKIDLDILTDEDASYSKVAEYKTAQLLQPAIADFNSKPLDEQEAIVLSLQKEKERSPAENDYLNAIETSYASNKTKIEDGVTYYVNNISPDSYKPLTSNLRQSLLDRTTIANGIVESGGKKAYLTDPEAEKFKDLYTGIDGDYPGMIGFAATVVDALGADEAGYIFEQMNEKKAYTLAMVGSLAQRGKTDPRDDGMTNKIMSDIVIGSELLYGKSKIPGIVPKTDFEASFAAETAGVFGLLNNNLRSSYMEGVRAVVAKKASDMGGDPAIISYADITSEAIAEVLGGELMEINNIKLMAPWRGADADAFEERLKQVSFGESAQFENLSERDAKGMRAEMQKDINGGWFGESSSLQYKSLGNGEYLVLNQDGRAYGTTEGKPFTINLSR